MQFKDCKVRKTNGLSTAYSLVIAHGTKVDGLNIGNSPVRTYGTKVD